MAECVELVVIMMVRPLGAARATCVAAIVPLAPGLGSTTIGVALIAFGLADAVVARLVRGRRTAYATLVVMSASLVAAAFPVMAQARLVGFAWFIEAEALVWLGVRTRAPLFTRIGIAGTALAGVQMFP